METVRQKIIALLGEAEMNARGLSQTLGIREREVYDHLPHIARTLSAQNKKLTVLPFQCLACGYTFKERKRFTRPGRCPRCKRGHVEWPLYRID